MKKIAVFLALSSVLVFAQQKGSFTDSRDGKRYKTVKIGTQTWIADNLNYVAEGSKCYDDIYANCQKYGRLYDWYAALEACPNGWHLPTQVEWDMLCRFVDTGEPYHNSSTAGIHLKAKFGWNWVPNKGEPGDGLDTYGFTALPGGLGNWKGEFHHIGDWGTFWTATERNANLAYLWLIFYDSKFVFSLNDGSKYTFLSVRCVKGD
ncbi:hypothetical protein R83H12_00541 [Fibrobacteria bacterium R8-3-H12]